MTELTAGSRILAINPTATTTEVAVFDGDRLYAHAAISHSAEELALAERVWDQFPVRRDAVLAWLAEQRVDVSSLQAAVGRGGLLNPTPGGTYRVTPPMLDDLRHGVQGEHASNLGGALAYAVARSAGVAAYVVDPVSTDELAEDARFAGLSDAPRTSLCHALTTRWVGRRAAAAIGKRYEECRMVIAHLGMGISVGAHDRGRIVDTNNAHDSGPFSPERAGTLPVGDLVKLCFSGKHTERELLRKLTTQSGLVAHLGTSDFREVERRMKQGDPVAALIYEAMAYQVTREIGAMAAALEGNVQAVVVTGPLAHSERFVQWISDRVSWIGPLQVYAGGDEVAALAAGARRVLDGEEEALTYP